MTKDEWKENIISACTGVGTYKQEFDNVIDSLASILEKRDTAEEQFKKSGGKAVIKYTNKGGATNPAKNPILVVWDELNKSALQYWRELGLTPAGLKKISENAMKPKKRSALADILEEFN